MKWLAAAATVLGCGGGRSVGSPATPAAVVSAPAVVVVVAPVFYRTRAALAYDITRQDSLTYESMGGGTPQVSDKSGLLVVRVTNGKTEVTLESIAAGAGTRLAASTLDGARGARWGFGVGRTGPVGPMRGGSTGTLVEQVGVIVRLLFPQLPSNGLGPRAVWSDSTTYSIRVDAFDATESAVRTSRATAVDGGVMVEASERLSRSGSATQEGQVMSLQGSGARWISYEFAREGWVTSLSVRDSLDLRVRVEAAGDVIPVRWRSSLTARLRGTPPR